MGRHERRSRKDRRWPASPVQFGLAPIILAVAGITVYSTLLPRPQGNAQIAIAPTAGPGASAPDFPRTGVTVPAPPVASATAPGPPAAGVTASALPAAGTAAPASPAGSAPSPGSSARPAASPGHADDPVPGAGAGDAGAGGDPVALLGVPDWSGYCAATGHGAARLTRSDAYGWHCADGSGIDAGAACALTFHHAAGQVIGRIQDFYDPGSWQCWQASRELGPPDFGGYCTATGQGAAHQVAGDAYGWQCAVAGQGDDANAVCAWTYGLSPSQVTNLFTDFYDPKSWQCWE